MKNAMRFLLAATAALASAIATADNDWLGVAGVTEWGDASAWALPDNQDWSNWYWIHDGNNPAHYNMTFSRTPDSTDEDDGHKDRYNVWRLNFRDMPSPAKAVFAGDDDTCGLRVREWMIIGINGRGALEIGKGTFEVRNSISVGEGSDRVGELTLSGGTLKVQNNIVLAKDKAASALFELTGGTLEIGGDITRGSAGDISIAANGGTIKTAGDNKTYDLANTVLGENGLTFDTAGHSVSANFSGRASAASDRATLTKTGEGMLTVDSLPQSARVTVEGGTLAVRCDLGGVADSIPITLAHRWSFNGNATDEVTGGEAQLLTNVYDSEAGGSISYVDYDRQVSLSGGANAVSFIDLGEGAVPNDNSPFAIELWATLREHGDALRVLSFGESNGDGQGSGIKSGFFLQFEGGGGEGPAHIVFVPEGGDWVQGDVGTTPLDVDTEYRFVVSVSPDDEAGSDVAASIFNAATGEKVGEWAQTGIAWQPSSCNFAHCYLGRSTYWNHDPKASFNEVRIWGKALSAAEVFASNTLGVDKLPQPELTHRWSFNGNLDDSAGDQAATFCTTNENSQLAYDESGTQAILPGGVKGTGYLNLGYGVLPAAKEPFTIEIWATQTNRWTDSTRLFSFGESNDGENAGMKSGLFMTFDGSGWEAQGNPTISLMQNGNWRKSEDVMASALEMGREYHFAVTYVPQTDGKATIRVFIFDAATGEKVGSKIYKDVEWDPSTIDWADNYLGHSPWSNHDAYACFNEVRIWNAALSETQLRLTTALGAESLDGGSGSAEIAAGATLDLCSRSAVFSSLSGSGTVAGGSLTVLDTVSPGGDGVVGTLTIDGDAVIRGAICLDERDKIIVTGTLDLSEARIEMKAPPSVKFPAAFAEGGISGVPAQGDGKQVAATLSEDGRTLYVGYYPFCIIVR